MKAMDRWWFRYTSPVEMGVFRIVMGFLILANQIMVGVDFDRWFSERGFVPYWLNARYLNLAETPRLNLLSGVTDDRITLLFYIAVTLAAFTTCIGLWTRVSTIVLALGIISLHHRNAMILHGGDLIIRMGAIYMALAPSGAACSVDRLIGLWKGKAPAIPAPVSIWPQRLVQFQVALVYFTTVWHKAFGTYWRDGTATWYPLHLNEFQRFWLPEFMRENAVFTAITTWGTLAVELALATLVFFKPWRKWAILGGIGLHLFIEYAMNIPLFAFLMIATYLSFYEGDEISTWAKAVGERFKRFRLTVRLPEGTEMQEGPARAIQATDAFSWVSYKTGAKPEWEAEASDGGSRPPFRSSLARSVGAWPLFLVPGAWRSLLRAGLSAKEPSGRPKQAKALAGKGGAS